jgi:hypothetical protein
VPVVAETMSHSAGAHRLRGMGIIATNAELWASIGTLIATVLLLAPGVVYAWYVLESWIDDGQSYAHVIETVYRR